MTLQPLLFFYTPQSSGTGLSVLLKRLLVHSLFVGTYEPNTHIPDGASAIRKPYGRREWLMHGYMRIPNFGGKMKRGLHVLSCRRQMVKRKWVFCAYMQRIEGPTERLTRKPSHRAKRKESQKATLPRVFGEDNRMGDSSSRLIRPAAHSAIQTVQRGKA